MIPSLFTLGMIGLVFAVASALVARAAAADARMTVRATRTDVEALYLQVSALSAAIRRVEGRQTGLSRRNVQPETVNGLPDPQLNPEGWRAAVRRMAVKPNDKKEIQ